MQFELYKTEIPKYLTQQMYKHMFRKHANIIIWQGEYFMQNALQINSLTYLEPPFPRNKL